MSRKETGSEALRQAQGELRFATDGAGFREITGDVQTWLRDIGARDGLATLFVRHTSASLTIQENADPDVLRDLADSLARLAPETHPYRHASEGSDDMPAHIKSMVTTTSQAIPVSAGRMALGTWQGIFLIEHRTRPHERAIALHFAGTLERPGG